MKKFNIAVIGATGMVGNKFLEVLTERQLPVLSALYARLPTLPTILYTFRLIYAIVLRIKFLSY